MPQPQKLTSFPATKLKRSGTHYVLHERRSALRMDKAERIYRLNLQHWALGNIWWNGESQLYAPLDLTTSSEEKPLHILDAGCGTGQKLSSM